MSQAALLRRLRNAQNGCFSLQRGPASPSYSPSPRDEVEAQQDYNRTLLASELLKIRAERADLPAGTLVSAAEECVAAAAVVYPELPEEAARAEAPREDPTP